MKCYLTVFILLVNLFGIYSQATVEDALIDQGVWFLFSTRIEEKFSDETLVKVDYFKKDDVSSIYFDTDDKLFSIFTSIDSTMLEDRWRMVDDTHFVIVSPVDKSSQIMDIHELSPEKLIISNCLDIEEGTRCLTHTFLSKKEGWLPDSEIDGLNSAGIINVNETTQ